jgi:hypothetical protein
MSALLPTAPEFCGAAKVAMYHTWNHRIASRGPARVQSQAVRPEIGSFALKLDP